MFQFIFQGTEEQFEFFNLVVINKAPAADIELEFRVAPDEWHCKMSDDNTEVFKVGMVLSACYSHFGHLESTQFSNQP